MLLLWRSSSGTGLNSTGGPEKTGGGREGHQQLEHKVLDDGLAVLISFTSNIHIEFDNIPQGFTCINSRVRCIS